MAKKKKTEEKQHRIVTTEYQVVEVPPYTTANMPYLVANVVSAVSNTEVAVANTEADVMPPDLREDYESSRTNLQRMMEIGLSAIERMADIADQTQNSKDYRVVGELLTALTGTNNQLLDVQKKLKELQGTSGDKKGKGMSVNNAVFFGTTNDLLELTSNTSGT